jgi:anaphase-promoting complex subunit 10
MAFFRPIELDDQNRGNKLTNGESGRQELGENAIWSVSSAKSGSGVRYLRDNDMETFWQSDGDQPHFINVQFHRKTTVEAISFYLNFKMDESYTPDKIAIRSGTAFYDLQEIRQFQFPERPQGWIEVPLVDDGEPSIKTSFLQVVIISNHMSGRDSHIRQVKVFGPKKELSRSAIEVPNFTEIENSIYETIR